jgi:transcriptional regulator with XRE-family HTH domain
LRQGQLFWYDIVQVAAEQVREGRGERAERMGLAERLKELRVRTNKSLQEVADEVGASKAHVWDLETGRAKNPSIDLLIKLSRCFKVSVADLVGETPHGEDEPSDLVAMYRDLKQLSPEDRQAIQSMMDHFRRRRSEERS